jgi:hypothetical protein
MSAIREITGPKIESTFSLVGCPVAMEPLRGRDGISNEAEPNAREEMSREIEVRLGVRRRGYRIAFVAFTLVVLVIEVPAAWLTPHLAGYILAASASAILGTAAVLLWAYSVRKSALYEQAGRSLLRER